jgi:hypothetical protein
MAIASLGTLEICPQQGVHALSPREPHSSLFIQRVKVLVVISQEAKGIIALNEEPELQTSLQIQVLIFDPLDFTVVFNQVTVLKPDIKITIHRC